MEKLLIYLIVINVIKQKKYNNHFIQSHYKLKIQNHFQSHLIDLFQGN
jgi:hypothetical protein